MDKKEVNKAIEDLFSFPTLDQRKEKESNEITQTPKKAVGRPRTNAVNPYRITFIVEPDVEDYMRQQPFLTMENRKEYINRLIREDFKKNIGATFLDDSESVQNKWNAYKEKFRRNF